MKTSAQTVERKVELILRAWESSCPEQSFADMTLEQFRQALQPFHDAKIRFAAMDTQWEAARQERNTAYLKALELAKGVASSVKGHPRFGENSAVYSAMGYVAKSDRGSGLTRRREIAPTKAPAEAS